MARAALFALILVSAAATIAASMAQDEQPPQRREGGDRQNQNQNRQMGPPPSTNMVVCKDFIFVLQGPTLYKIDPNEMKIVAELQVFKPKTEGTKTDQPKREPDRDK